MDSLRLVLLLVGAVIVLLVLLDLYRRLRRERREGGDWQGIEPVTGADPLDGDGDGLRPGRDESPPDLEEWVGEARVRPGKPPAGAGEPAPATPGALAPRPSAAVAPQRPEPAPQRPPVARKPSDPPAPEQVFALHIMAKNGERFAGPAVLEALGAADLEFGAMGIFHYHQGATAEGERLFSVANVLKPGTLEPGRMAGFETPGLVMFMSLPGPSNPLIAFDVMIKAARLVSRQLAGELRDDRRSVLTEQTIQHQREQIQEFRRKHLAARPRP